MRSQIAILVFVLAAVAANAAELNCTTLAKPNHNFYEPSGACANDTVINTCLTSFFTCVNAASTCDAGFVCVSAKLRCLENAAPGSECTSWAAMLGNEKLYIAAGGDYNGSTLELSCLNVVCGFMKVKGLSCPASSYANVCVDHITGATPVPGSTPVSTIPPPGAIVVTFTISGDSAKFTALLSTDAGRRQAFAIVTKILMAVLGVDASKIVIIDIRVGSLIVDFYTTDPNLSVETVRSKLEGVNSLPNKNELFAELAEATGIDVSQLGVTGVTVSTQAPLTEAPLTDAASLATVAAALAAVLLALLL